MRFAVKNDDEHILTTGGRSVSFGTAENEIEVSIQIFKSYSFFFK